MPTLTADDEIRMQSVMEAIRNVVGLTLRDQDLVNAVLKNDYDFERALDAILNNETKELPPATTTNKTDMATGEFLHCKWIWDLLT